MPRPAMNRRNEKSQNFLQAMKRLFSELRMFRILIGISLVLAALSSILSIASPNKLSKLTDEIGKGLVLNQKNLESISNTISNNLKNTNYEEILINPNISEEDKTTFMQVISTWNYENPQSILSTLNLVPTTIIDIMLPNITFEGANISTEDQLDFLNKSTSMMMLTNVNEIYQKVDEMPESIQKVIKPSMNIDNIKKIVLTIAIIYILSALFSFGESIIMTIVSNNFARNLRERISKKINLLPLKYFDDNQTGDTLSRVTNDVDTIAMSLNNSLSTLVSATTLFLGTTIMMFYTNWLMALTAIISSLFGFMFMGSVLSKSQKYFAKRQEELGKLNSHIEEVYSGLLVIKAYNGKETADIKFNELNKNVYDANRKSQFLSGLMMPMMSFVGNLGYVAVCIVGALLTQKGAITFGVIVAFITYVRLFNSPLSQIAQSMTSLQSSAAASERVFAFLDEKELPEEHTNILLDTKSSFGKIEFKNVSFGYDKSKLIIKNFTAKASKGQKIAIVGPTGAGKTTIVNLLMKFYEINSGDILIDNQSISNLTRENIHSMFTMVLQDTWLFDGTLRENIVYNHENVSDEEVMRVCDVVGLTHFVKTLPEGLNTMLSENDSISSGQKQLITIARGMIKSSPFLILDEATSNVDTRTEELVAKAMDKLMENRTSFIIAHRLSTIKNADLILVMKDGNIIEQGNHDELINQNGFYADLYNSQFEL